MLHQAFHVVLMVAFVLGIALAFLGLAGPLLLGQERKRGTLRVSLVIGAAALVALGADWAIHGL